MSTPGAPTPSQVARRKLPRIVRVVRARQGVNLALTFAEIPPE